MPNRTGPEHDERLKEQIWQVPAVETGRQIAAGLLDRREADDRDPERGRLHREGDRGQRRVIVLELAQGVFGGRGIRDRSTARNAWTPAGASAPPPHRWGRAAPGRAPAPPAWRIPAARWRNSRRSTGSWRSGACRRNPRARPQGQHGEHHRDQRARWRCTPSALPGAPTVRSNHDSTATIAQMASVGEMTCSGSPARLVGWAPRRISPRTSSGGSWRRWRSRTCIRRARWRPSRRRPGGTCWRAWGCACRWSSCTTSASCCRATARAAAARSRVRAPRRRWRATAGCSPALASSEVIQDLGTAPLRDETVAVILARLLSDVYLRWTGRPRTSVDIHELPMSSPAYDGDRAAQARELDPAWSHPFIQRLVRARARGAGAPRPDRRGRAAAARAVLVPGRRVGSRRPVPGGQHVGRGRHRRLLAAAPAVAAGDQAAAGGAALLHRRLRVGRAAREPRRRCCPASWRTTTRSSRRRRCPTTCSTTATSASTRPGASCTTC